MGLFILAFRVALNKSFGVLGGYVDIVENAADPRRMGMSGFLLLGVVLGGMLYAVLTGTFLPVLAYASDLHPLWLLGAGLAMGYGARLAGGCTSGHGLTGLSLGSPASLVASLTFFGVALIMARASSFLAGGHL